MSLKDDFLRGLTALKPPDHEATPKQLHNWRWAMAVITGVNAMTLAAHVALACGLVPAVYGGFASAADLRSLQVGRAADLGLKIIEAKEKQCEANVDERVQMLYRESIARMEAEYENLMGREFKTPTCIEFRR